MTEPTSPSSTPPPELTLLRVLHSPAPGPSRSWQSIPHPDPSTPLLATASADKSVNIWNLRDFSLISTINGGHKRSVRTVAWKDFGKAKKDRNPVVLGTGSFDANVGIWIWNDDRRWARFRDGADNNGTSAPPPSQPQQNDDITAAEVDMTRDGGDQDDDDEEWHFSTLLTGPDSEIKSIEFSPPHYSANLLATCSRDKSVWIWEEVEPEEWETIAVLSEHTGDVKCVSWCAGAVKGNGQRKRRKLQTETGGDVEMGNNSHTDSVDEEDADEEVVVLGSREILASGSYDDTIRLWRDVEEEGDWICVGVIDGHKGTVWDIKWEGYINYAQLASAQEAEAEVEVAEFEADWAPRMVSCSDDLTVRVWRRELNEAERAKKAQARSNAPTGFASSRLPSTIRPPSSMERWVEDAALPQVHVRSVYAIDWSRRSGLVVSCGGDGTIAVYKEIVDTDNNNTATNGNGTGDVLMDGTGNTSETEAGAVDNELPYKLHKMKWTVVAQIEGAHDEFEINHVCWAARRDKDRQFDGEEVIVSTGDEGDVRIWTLPEALAIETGGS